MGQVKDEALKRWKEIYNDWDSNHKSYKPKNIWESTKYESRLVREYVGYNIFLNGDWERINTEEVVNAYTNYIVNDGIRSQCDEYTLKIYDLLRRNISEEKRKEVEKKSRDAICAWNFEMDKILEEYGISKGNNNRYRVRNLNKFFLKVWDEYLDKRIQELGIKGLKLKNRKTVTCNAQELFDFRNAEFAKSESEENTETE